MMKRRLRSIEIYPYVKGKCRVCHGELTGRRRTFCSDKCVEKLKDETDWKRIRIRIFKRDKGRCQICDKALSRHGHNSFHVDHIIPLAKGGKPYSLRNLQLLCPECNLRKSDKLLDEHPVFLVD